MNRWLLLVSFRPAAEANDVNAWMGAANAAASGWPDVEDSSVDLNLPGSVGGGDAVWDLRTQPGSVLDVPWLAELTEAACVQSVEALALDTITSGHRSSEGARVKRTLLLTVRTGTPEPQVHRFERSLQAMPDHIPEIGSWSLSRVRQGASTGGWTHAWEQEYADLAGLRVAYVQSPYHWTGVDRWFDPEVPCSIVQPRLAHMFRWADRPVLTADSMNG